MAQRVAYLLILLNDACHCTLALAPKSKELTTAGQFIHALTYRGNAGRQTNVWRPVIVPHKVSYYSKGKTRGGGSLAEHS